MTFIFWLRLSTYKLDKAVSAKDSTSLDKKIENLVRAKEKIEKRGNQYSFVEPITKEDLAKLNFSEDLTQSLKITLKKLSDAEIQLKIERDWLAEQVEKKSIEVLKTIDQLIKAENAKSQSS